jgi:hypothetical protein
MNIFFLLKLRKCNIERGHMNGLTNISQLTAEIVLLKNQTAQNIIEIGKRLIEVKEQLPHGEWGKWLEEKVEFTDRTAQKFMKVASEISNTNTYSHLTQSKVFALLDLPQEQRQDFIESNPVDEMTTRQLAQAIKEKKEVERQLEAERNKPPRIVERVVEKKPADYDRIKEEIKRNDESVRKLNEYTESLKKAYASSKARVDRYEQTEKRIEDLTKTEGELLERVRTITELSEFSFEIEKMLKEKLAPIRYSKSLKRLDNKVARDNLESIVNNVSMWLNEMKGYLNQDYVEVIDYESID